MLKVKILLRLALIICAVSAVTACGQKGDLYLPEGSNISGWMS